MFILSKIVLYLFSPLLWVIGLFSYSYITKKENRKRKSRNLGFIFLIFFTNPFLATLVTNWWNIGEKDMSEIEIPYDIGIVLGGFTTDIPSNRDRIHFNNNVERLTNALELYHQKKIKKILLTGGNPRIFKDAISEARLAENFLLKTGFPKEDILIEDQSRNTYENARNVSEIIKSQFPDARCLVISSASHLRRAKRTFKKTNLDFDIFSTGISTGKISFSFNKLIIPSLDGFHKWDRIFYECFGLFYYKLRGYI